MPPFLFCVMPGSPSQSVGRIQGRRLFHRSTRKRKMETTAMTDDEKKIQVFMQMKTAWEAKDWVACADLMAEDGILHSVMLEPCQGRQNFYERIRKTEKPNKRVILNIRSIGVAKGILYVERNDEIIIDGHSRFIPTMGVIEFAGDQIAHWREYYDRATLLHAIGENHSH